MEGNHFFFLGGVGSSKMIGLMIYDDLLAISDFSIGLSMIIPRSLTC